MAHFNDADIDNAQVGANFSLTAPPRPRKFVELTDVPGLGTIVYAPASGEMFLVSRVGPNVQRRPIVLTGP